MTVIPRFLAVLALLAAVLPAVSAHGKKPHCKPNEYYYERKGYCVAKNHHKNHAVDPPRGKGCPSHWYWSDAKHCCLPYSPIHKSDTNHVPPCPKGQKWDDKGSYCHGPPSRSSGSHHGNNKPHHGDDKPHHGNNKPHHGNNHHDDDYPHHGHDNHHNSGSHHGRCHDGEFWYEPRHTCLTRGGPSRTHTPPTGSQCPQQGWHWDKDLHCCVPSHQNHPSPTCPNGWYWNDGNHRCQKKSTPASPNHPDPTHRGYNFKRVEEQSVPL